ncbi:MaoC/PaaZ C-terminal domain-containing protein [Chloroflexota bacterium]
MSEGLFFENINVGDEILPLTKDLTQVGMVMYSAATWDFARVHYDKDFVQSRGRQTPFADGQMLGAFLAEMVVNWIGESGTLKKMDFRFRKMLSPGDRIICKGTVVEKSTENDQKLVKCDLWIEEPNGEKVLAPASALIGF